MPLENLNRTCTFSVIETDISFSDADHLMKSLYIGEIRKRLSLGPYITYVSQYMREE